jgi:hypothetical protein
LFGSGVRTAATRSQRNLESLTIKMRHPVYISKKVVVAGFVAILAASGLLELGRSPGQAITPKPTTESSANSSKSASEGAVDLSASQLNSIKIEPVGIHRFDVKKQAVGNISYADDLSVDVFLPSKLDDVLPGPAVCGFYELVKSVRISRRSLDRWEDSRNGLCRATSGGMDSCTTG